MVDSTSLPPDRGGVGRYVDELIARLPSAGAEVFVVCQAADAGFYNRLVGQDHVFAAPRWVKRPALRFVWEQLGLPALVRRLEPDVMHSPHYTLPIWLRSTGVARVVTLHDATFFTHPDLHNGIKAKFFASWTRLSVRVADALITPSEATRDELVTLLGADPSRFRVILHGVNADRFHRPSEHEIVAMREHLGIGDAPYLAFLGTLEPRKNLPALVRAYAKVAPNYDVPPKLVLAGTPGWDAHLDEEIAAIPESLEVVKAGFLPDQLLAPFLGDAVVVAYPSLGEGFGLPLAEAMACGAMVVTTRELSLPEVGGDAPIYAASPADHDLADALTEALDNPQWRAERGRLGVERAGALTWFGSAAEHLAVYQSVKPVLPASLTRQLRLRPKRARQAAPGPVR
ncbi:MAG TPA: glycosyltransferase family 1 protein [Pedococcus sp.]|nr:glycosyltransferase family 1 protein [Pedococcus sp.]